MTAEWFDAAVDAENDSYLEAETQLRDAVRAEPDQRAAVTARLDDPDPLARLVAHVVLSDADLDESQAAQVDAYLVEVQQYYADTAARVPPVSAVVEELTAQFGAQLGELLAVRLAKSMGPPAWRDMVSVAYLTRHPTPAATEALLRYAARASVPRLQTAAAQAVAASRDPDLRHKLAAESRRLAANGQALPAAVISVLA
jgi:hypothetical protein